MIIADVLKRISSIRLSIESGRNGGKGAAYAEVGSKEEQAWQDMFNELMALEQCWDTMCEELGLTEVASLL